MKHAVSIMIPFLLAAGSLAGAEDVITLSDEAVLLNGEALTEDASVKISHDIIYYEDKDAYESGNPYGEGSASDKHSAEEAAEHTVVTITEPGTYRISGTLSKGQLAVDLGKEAKRDPEAVVTLLMENADITCTVAPAVIFYYVYECDTAWVAYDDKEAEKYDASSVTDLTEAGARVILADGSVNNIHGAYVAKIYKDTEEQKKMYKFDGAFYSKMSMTVDGEEAGNGVLNIEAENEGLNSELHLTINGGEVNIKSQDDGINTNEDNVSVTTINGGNIHILGGLGKEGDGIDSNGYLVINGGTVVASANPAADSGLDSDLGSYINGGYVISTGSVMDWPESESDQVTMNLQFASMQDAGSEIEVKDMDGNVVFYYEPDTDAVLGDLKRNYQGAVISCPEFAVGESYQVYVGGEQQIFSGNEIGRGHGGFKGGHPDGFQNDKKGKGKDFDPKDMDKNRKRDQKDGKKQKSGNSSSKEEVTEEMPAPPEISEGMDPAEMPAPPEIPEGMDPAEMPAPPEMPEGMEPPAKPDGTTSATIKEDADSAASSSNIFVMTDKVNAFASVKKQ